MGMVFSLEVNVFDRKRRRHYVHRQQRTNNQAGFVCLGRCPAGRPLRK
jgi:hypothetical protein